MEALEAVPGNNFSCPSPWQLIRFIYFIRNYTTFIYCPNSSTSVTELVKMKSVWWENPAWSRIRPQCYIFMMEYITSVLLMLSESHLMQYGGEVWSCKERGEGERDACMHSAYSFSWGIIELHWYACWWTGVNMETVCVCSHKKHLIPMNCSYYSDYLFSGGPHPLVLTLKGPFQRATSLQWMINISLEEEGYHSLLNTSKEVWGRRASGRFTLCLHK